MKIESVQIKNVRSFKDETTVLFHDALNLLIGPNAGGKSNLLDILTVVIRKEFLHGYQVNDEDTPSGLRKSIHMNQPFRDSYKERLAKFYGDNGPSTITITFKPTQEDIRNLTTLIQRRADIESTLTNYINGQNYQLKFLDSWNVDGLNSELPLQKNLVYDISGGTLGSRIPDKECALFHSYLNWFELASILDSQHDLGLNLTSCYYYFSPLRGVERGSFTANLSATSYTQTLTGYSEATSRSRTGVANLGTMYLAAKRRRYEAEADGTGYGLQWNEDKDVQMLRKNLQRLGYDWNLRLIDPSKNLYQGKLFRNGKSAEISEASSGEQEIINFILGIFARNLKGGILLVDEPELHLHPQWQIWLLAAFKDIIEQYGNQIIICTHSDMFITPETIYNVTRVYRDQDGLSHTVAVSTEGILTMRNAVHIINAHNNQKMFFADVVLLVEGIKDRLIFDRLIKLYLETMGDPRVIEVLEVHGKHNFQAYHQFLESIKVKVLQVSDLDYLHDVGTEEVRKLLEVDYPSIDKNVLGNKGSDDRLVLAELLETAIKTDNLEQLSEIWKYIKQRHLRLKNTLSVAEQGALHKFLEDAMVNRICILSKGEIEDYLPKDKRNLDRVIELVSEGSFEKWLDDHWDSPEVLELRRIVGTVVGIGTKDEIKVRARLATGVAH